MRIVALILWLLFWSLGSVLLIRLSEKVDRETIKGILRWRSKCPHCGATLKARNLIPLLSFLLQRGKCDQCKHSISRLYPILEIGSAIIFVVSFLVFQEMWVWIIIFWCVVNRLCFLLIAYDVMKYELHVPLRIILIIVLITGSVFGLWWTVTQALASLWFFAVGYGIIYLWAKRYARMRYGASEWFGQWDLYLGAAIGLWVPFILKYNFIARWRSWLVNIFLLFIILSSIIWIILRIILKVILHRYPKLMKNNVSPLFQGRLLIPFIPAMILAFWLLLRKADFFISLLFPLW
jgi:prepilin signal peptidase PulO-like enzyme (type II secretory pathway)